MRERIQVGRHTRFLAMEFYDVRSRRMPKLSSIQAPLLILEKEGDKKKRRGSTMSAVTVESRSSSSGHAGESPYRIWLTMVEGYGARAGVGWGSARVARSRGRGRAMQLCRFGALGGAVPVLVRCSAPAPRHCRGSTGRPTRTVLWRWKAPMPMPRCTL